jgi:hypothetical protein
VRGDLDDPAWANSYLVMRDSSWPCGTANILVTSA